MGNTTMESVLKMMARNIANIIHNNGTKSISKIESLGGICANKSDFCYGLKFDLSFCSWCNMLVCYRCINNKKDKCVLCELEKNENILRHCELCNYYIIFNMCNSCGKIIKTCKSDCIRCDYLRFTIFPDDNEIIWCEKC